MCLNPLYSLGTDDKGRPSKFLPPGVRPYTKNGWREFPCGKCDQCRAKRASEWATRCMHEAKHHDHSLFITLTYRPADLPPGRTLDKRHLCLFWKRLRKAFAPKPLRYFACGEYGTKGDRPHYHAIVFGLRLPDLRSCPGRPGLQTSNLLESLWGHGFVSVGKVTHQSARYVASYTSKSQQKEFLSVDQETGLLRQAPFTTFSNGGGRHKGLSFGLGYAEYSKNHRYWFSIHHCPILQNGRRRLVPIPKYYFRKLKQESYTFSPQPHATPTGVSDAVKAQLYECHRAFVTANSWAKEAQDVLSRLGRDISTLDNLTYWSYKLERDLAKATIFRARRARSLQKQEFD